MKFCPKCGTSSPDTHAYCNRCGYAYNDARPNPGPNPNPNPGPNPGPGPNPNLGPNPGPNHGPNPGPNPGPAPSPFLYNPRPYMPQRPAEHGRGFAIAGMVCGIVSFFIAGFILGLLGIIFGGVAKSKGYRGGMATAGIVCGVIALTFVVVAFIIGLFSSAASSFFYMF